jgi:uncharacterized protein (TIRG00374 family)
VKRAAQALGGIAISGIALWLTLRGKDLGAIALALRGGDYRYVAPYVLVLLAIHVLRTLRWGLLLAPVSRVPFRTLNAISAVGFMALSVLPFRLGELARPWLVAERQRIRISSALSSIVVERVADGIFMGLLLVAALLAVPDGAPGVRLVRAAGLAVSVAFALALAFLVLAYSNRDRAVRLARWTLRPVSARLADRIAGMLDAFIHGLRVLPGRGALALFFGLTALYWGLNAFGLAVLARGFGFSLGPVEACALLGVLVVGVMIPAGPGMVGTFQGALVIGLSLFAPAEAVATRGTAYANVVWAVQLAQVVLLGLPFLFSGHVRLAGLTGTPGAVGAELEAEEDEYRAG